MEALDIVLKEKSLTRQDVNNTAAEEAGIRAAPVCGRNAAAAVSHPNICRLLAVSADGPQRRRCLVLELYSGGALDKVIETNPTPQAFIPRQQLQAAVAIGRALAHLHLLSPPMIHRGLVVWTPRNQAASMV